MLFSRALAVAVVVLFPSVALADPGPHRYDAMDAARIVDELSVNELGVSVYNAFAEG